MVHNFLTPRGHLLVPGRPVIPNHSPFQPRLFTITYPLPLGGLDGRRTSFPDPFPMFVETSGLARPIPSPPFGVVKVFFQVVSLSEFRRLFVSHGSAPLESFSVACRAGQEFPRSSACPFEMTDPASYSYDPPSRVLVHSGGLGFAFACDWLPLPSLHPFWVLAIASPPFSRPC